MHAKLRINGVVQGVGFRPFVYRIATQLNLKGYVLNLGNAGVEIEVEGEEYKIKNLRAYKNSLLFLILRQTFFQKSYGYQPVQLSTPDLLFLRLLDMELSFYELTTPGVDWVGTLGFFLFTIINLPS